MLEESIEKMVLINLGSIKPNSRELPQAQRTVSLHPALYTLTKEREEANDVLPQVKEPKKRKTKTHGDQVSDFLSHNTPEPNPDASNPVRTRPPTTASPTERDPLPQSFQQDDRELGLEFFDGAADERVVRVP